MRIDYAYAASSAIENKIASKHKIDIEEVNEVFRNQPLVRTLGRDQYGEMRYGALGQTDEGRYLSIVFVYQFPNLALAKVITVREMSSNEKRTYRRQKRR